MNTILMGALLVSFVMLVPSSANPALTIPVIMGLHVKISRVSFKPTIIANHPANIHQASITDTTPAQMHVSNVLMGACANTNMTPASAARKGSTGTAMHYDATGSPWL
jgi:hypothetical protein